MTDRSFGLGALAVAMAMAAWLAGCGVGYEDGDANEDADIVGRDGGSAAPITPGASWSEAGAPSRKTTDAGDAGAALEPVEGGAAPDVAPVPATDECTSAGVVIYASVDATSAWRYAANPLPPDGFHYQGPVFRMAPDTTSRPHAPLYLLKNEANGDYVVSTVPTEGAGMGYGVLSVLGNVFLEKVPGSVPLLRYYQEEPRLRHLVTISPSTDAAWKPEPPRGYVCPR